MDFQEKSFNNLIGFFEEELHQVVEGGRAQTVFKTQQIKSLKLNDILETKHIGGQGRRTVLTSKALDRLKER